MRVELVQATPKAGKMVADIASICYGKEEARYPDKLLKREYRCLVCSATWLEQEAMNMVCKGEKPSYVNPYAAGLDIRSNTDVVIEPGQIVDIETLLAVEIPAGYFGMLVARSGLSFKHQIKLINDVGIIDEDYRGYIGVRLINEGKEPYHIKVGDRVAQMIIIPYIQVPLRYVDELSETERGEGGFGHTGK